MRILTLLATDPKFPVRLRYARGPVKLEAIGQLGDRLDHLQKAVAIVGTRTPSRGAWRYTYWLAAKLAEAGATIVSGGAYGIDAAAHEGALSVGGQTIAILPGSIDMWQPAGNSALFRRICAGGGALVAFLDRHEKPRYHERNAAIAALSEHVVVVAAPLKSGARNTAAEARRFKSELWIVPGSPWDQGMTGNNLELDLGGLPLRTPCELLEALAGEAGTCEQHRPLDHWTRAEWDDAPDDPNPRPSSPVVTESLPLASSKPSRRSEAVARTAELTAATPEERRVVEALQKGPCTVDELCLATSLPVTRLAGLLLTWTALGVVREGPLGLYRLING